MFFFFFLLNSNEKKLTYFFLNAELFFPTSLKISYVSQVWKIMLITTGSVQNKNSNLKKKNIKQV